MPCSRDVVWTTVEKLHSVAFFWKREGDTGEVVVLSVALAAMTPRTRGPIQRIDQQDSSGGLDGRRRWNGRKDQRRTESQFFLLGRRDSILERFSSA